MRYAFAPLEGVTDSVYRRLHHQFFPGVDTYFMPFFSPTTEDKLSSRELRELPPADSVPFAAVPQILTRDAGAFLRATRILADLGYRQVNLNLGCPSGTVFTKGKGSGMLRNPQELARFLDTIFADSPLPISVKTRIGVERGEEWPTLLALYNQYPIAELIIHPRLRQEFYKGHVHMDAFALACRESKNPLCYNGDLITRQQIQALCQAHPELSSVMVGRGLVGNPGLFTPGGTTIPALEAFHTALLEEYIFLFGGSRNAMFRMKENWRYLLCLFDGSAKLGKRLKKTTDLAEYKSITAEIFHTLPLRSEPLADWVEE